MYMRIREIKSESPEIDKGSRYLLKCAYPKLIKTPLTKQIYFIIHKEGECTTTQICKDLKKQGYRYTRAKVLTYLDTMAEHRLLEKTIRGANIAHWQLGKDRHSIAEEELLREIDIDALGNLYSPDQIFHVRESDYPGKWPPEVSKGTGVHLYGLPRKYFPRDSEKTHEFLEEMFNICSIIHSQFEPILRLRYIMMVESFSKKIHDWKKKYPGPWDEAVFFLCFYSFRFPLPDSLIEHFKETDVLRPGFVNKPFPSWIKDSDGKTIISYTREDMKDILKVSEALKKCYFPSLTIATIVNKLNNYQIPKGTLELCKYMHEGLTEHRKIPLSIVATYHTDIEFMMSMYEPLSHGSMDLLDDKLLEKKIDEKDYAEAREYLEKRREEIQKAREQLDQAELDKAFEYEDKRREAEFLSMTVLEFKSFLNPPKLFSKDVTSPASPKNG